MHCLAKTVSDVNKSLTSLFNPTNNSLNLITTSFSECPDALALKSHVSEFVVATMNSRDSGKPSVLLVGVEQLSDSLNFYLTGIRYLTEHLREKLFQSMGENIQGMCGINQKRTVSLAQEELETMVAMDVLHLTSEEKGASLPVPVLLVTVFPNSLACKDCVFYHSLQDKMGKTVRRAYRLLCDSITGAKVMELTARDTAKLEKNFKT